MQRMNEEILEKGVARCTPRAMIIDGPSLITAMADVEPAGIKTHLLELGKKCKAVVGCR